MKIIDADALVDVLTQRCCKNCIKRMEIKNGKQKMVYEIGDAPCLACEVDDIKVELDEAPTIDAEPIRHGHWIECESENGIHFHKCSECGMRDMYQGTFTDWNGRGFSFYYKRQYCPVCGATMDDEVNDV